MTTAAVSSAAVEPRPNRGGRPRAPGRDVMIAVAAELFDTRGYNQTTMDDLAEALGIAKVTVYAHLKSKADVLEAIFDHALGQAEAQLAAALEKPTPTEQIEALIRTFTVTGLEMSSHQKVYLNGDKSLPVEALERSRRRAGDLLAAIRRIIKAGQQSGEFDPALEATTVANAIIHTVGSTPRWVKAAGRATTEQIASTHAALFISGLRGASTPAKQRRAGSKQ